MLYWELWSVCVRAKLGNQITHDEGLCVNVRLARASDNPN